MFLQKIIYELALIDSDVSFRNDYSGRGMYGNCCVGITGTDQACRRLIADAIKELQQRTQLETSGGSELENTQLFNEGVDTLLSWSTDRMGIVKMIYYWPTLEAIEVDNPVWQTYSGECPDCGEGIPLTVAEGDCCANCGHSFHEQQEEI